MIGLLKKPLLICQPEWKEIRSAFPVIHWVDLLVAQNKDIGAASQTLLTEAKLRLRRKLFVQSASFSLFAAKFVVSRCAYCKLRRDLGFFCSVNHFSNGGVNAKSQCNMLAQPGWEWSRLLKNSEGNRDAEWIFCRRKEADVALFLQMNANVTSRLLPETRRSQSNEPWNTKETKRVEIHQSWITNNDLLNSCK